MIQLTDAEYDNLIRRTAGVLSNFQPGEDAVAVLSRIYRENLPDKSPRQGELMARELIGWISRFRGSCDAAAADPEGYVRYMLTDILKDQPSEIQCQLLGALIGGEQDGIVSDTGNQEELMEQAVRLMSNCTDLPQTAPEGYDLRQRAKFHCGEDMILAATAMMLYTMAKNGELTGFPRDITLAQTALCVCANDSQCQLMWLEASGNLAQSELAQLLHAVSLAFKMLWLAMVIPKVITAFTVAGAFAITASGLSTLGILGILTALAFHEFDQMLSFGAEMITEVPLKLHAMGSMTLEAPRTRQEMPTLRSISPPAADAFTKTVDEDPVTDIDDDPVYF